MKLPKVLPLHHRGMLRGAELNRHNRVVDNPQSTARYEINWRVSMETVFARREQRGHRLWKKPFQAVKSRADAPR